jgi:SAM-dependent methyltransferases related to tRNA (uracil-5-)-methyltransferase
MSGQKISFAVNKMRSGKAEGRLLEVLEKSPLENREKSCRSFGDCGGYVPSDRACGECSPVASLKSFMVENE